jgi:DNA helicase II / ATP-dependent DNA helicase PcrA
VLVVGPTSSYSRHIRDVVLRLGDSAEKIVVLSMPELMQKILNVKNEPTGPATSVWFDADSMLGRLSRLAIDLCRHAGDKTISREKVYECLQQNKAGGRALTRKADWASYLVSLPPYRKALGLRAQRPLLAFIEWEIARPVGLGQVGHVIVDEAQDVTALEWCLLHSINKDNAWTILGDLNQRRSDHTLSSWNDVFDELALDPDTEIRHLARAYRSTKPILEFANKLLPRKQRVSEAFQYEGPQPRVSKVNIKELSSAVCADVRRLTADYPLGTVAIITVQPEPITKSLRKIGWTATSVDMRLWQLDGAEVAVLQPGSSRGLEFDAVIVVEPADFPTNYGRQGPLYTALTRANRELAVVHSKPLPRELKLPK